MTKPKRYKRYSAEFKKQAILRAAEEGITDKAVCEELGISAWQFRRWHVELDVLGKDANDYVIGVFDSDTFSSNHSANFCTLQNHVVTKHFELV